MQKLTKTEEYLMDMLWEHGNLFMKEIIELHSDPRPAPTTIATLLKRMQEKGFVGYNLYGNSRQYYPMVEKTDYFSNKVKGMVSNFFNDSPLEFASFFTSSTDLSDQQLVELREIIENEIKKRES